MLHIGDVHSGSMRGTGAGLTAAARRLRPRLESRDLRRCSMRFKDPVVYTPGDNEWTDCHKTKEFSSGAPAQRAGERPEAVLSRTGLHAGRAEASAAQPGAGATIRLSARCAVRRERDVGGLARGLRDAERARLEQRRPAVDRARSPTKQRGSGRSPSARGGPSLAAVAFAAASRGGRSRADRPAGGHVGSRGAHRRRRRAQQLHRLRAAAGRSHAPFRPPRCCSSTATRTSSAPISRSRIRPAPPV